jgi:hypothetical protein
MENGEMIIVHFLFDQKPTGIYARDGEELRVGMEVETVQGSKFRVWEQDGKFWLRSPDGLFDLDNSMSPNLFIV